MKKLLVTSAVSTLIVVATAAPAAFADTTAVDPSLSSGTSASNQLQPAGAGTQAVPETQQIDEATYDQLRAAADPLQNYQAPAAAHPPLWMTIGTFVAGLLLGALLVLTWQRRSLKPAMVAAEPAPAAAKPKRAPAKTKPAKS